MGGDWRIVKQGVAGNISVWADKQFSVATGQLCISYASKLHNMLAVNVDDKVGEDSVTHVISHSPSILIWPYDGHLRIPTSAIPKRSGQKGPKF